jgi:hypothetical protein
VGAVAGRTQLPDNLVPRPCTEPRAWNQHEFRHGGKLAQPPSQVHPKVDSNAQLNLDVKTLHRAAI